MVTQSSPLYAHCPYLHFDPNVGRSALVKHCSDGFRVLARLLSITGPAVDEESGQRQGSGGQAITATFETVGADWAMGWLGVSEQDWISDVKGKPINSRFTLRNVPLGRFTYQPSEAPWDMMLLQASLGKDLVEPFDALRRWRHGITPAWFEARVTLGFAHVLFCPVTYFPSIFDAGIPAAIDSVKALSEESLIAVGERFSMPSILKRSARPFERRLSRLRLRAEHLAVYDVGQGAAQALIRLEPPRLTPELYVDMGCGRNHTKDAHLQTLRFCTSASPPVILSHADEDHWCGAITKAMAAADYPAHKLEWTAPATSGSLAFMTFASSVWASKGSVRTLDLTAVPTATIAASTNTGSLLIAQGTSKQFNDSGLIVAAVREDNESYWMLPGDCDYHFFPAKLKSMAASPSCVALTAVHHGAALLKPAAIPKAAGGRYQRLVYSFGCGNGHGHPTINAATGHEAAGWKHGPAWLAAPGSAKPGGHSRARATAWTPSVQPPYEHAGGVLIGWSVPILPRAAVCCASGCAAEVPIQV